MDSAEEQVMKIVIAMSRSSVKGLSTCISKRYQRFYKLVKTSHNHLFKIYILRVQVPDKDVFDDMDTIYASPDDFEDINNMDRIRGIFCQALQ
ncbi:hypothetical protein SUGI_0626350 [Cryptomeria japonica]|nr:hypothetical protein SUGI_0626350 [Cryptomeria japonica]